MNVSVGASEKEGDFNYLKQYENGGLKVRLLVSTDSITTAGRARLRLEARAPAGHILNLPPAKARIGEFEVRQAIPSPSRLTGNAAFVEQQIEWVLEPFLPGEYEIPALEVSARPIDGGDELTIQTEPVTVSVTTVFPLAAKEVSLRPLAPVFPRQSSWVPILLFLVAAPPLLTCLLRLSCGETSKVGESAVRPPADETAMANLQSLKQAFEGASAAGRIQEILAGYVRARFGRSILAQTADELKASLEVGPEAGGILDRLADSLQRARYGSGASDTGTGAAWTAMELLEQFIEVTRERRSGAS